MNKVWYICIDGKEEGPFSIEELRYDRRVNLDTLVWKEGFENWVPLRKVRELKKIFKPPRADQEQEKEEIKKKPLPPQDELAIDFGRDPNLFFLWLILAVALILYIVYEFYWQP